MREQATQPPSKRCGTSKRSILVLLGLCLCAVSFHAASPSIRRHERLRSRKLSDGVGAVGDVLGNMDMDMDEDIVVLAASTVGAAIAGVAALAGACITALTGGAILGEVIDRNVHRIDSTIEYAIPTTVETRDLSYGEEEELRQATRAFYEATLQAAYPGELQELRVVSTRHVREDGSNNPLVEIIDTIFGNDRNYGFEWDFTVIVAVADRKTLTFGEVFSTINGADYANYVTSYLSPLTTNIISLTETAVYTDRLDD